MVHSTLQTLKQVIPKQNKSLKHIVLSGIFFSLGLPHCVKDRVKCSPDVTVFCLYHQLSAHLL